MSTIKFIFAKICVLVVLLELTEANVMLPNPNCFRPCPSIYAPVCGSNGKDYHLFASDCVMEVENCILKRNTISEFTKTDMVKCERNRCNNMCTREYHPICGFNGSEFKTFSNKCTFDYENCISNDQWRLIRTGQKCDDYSKLIDGDKKSCPVACTFDYRPVCGSDGSQNITYSNMCMFEQANCYGATKLHFVKNGEC